MIEKQKKALQYALDMLHAWEMSDRIEKIVLFGSAARGTARWNSDIDLYVELSDVMPQDKQFKESLLLLKGRISPPDETLAEVDVKIGIGNKLETEHNCFYNNIRKDGVILWERN